MKNSNKTCMERQAQARRNVRDTKRKQKQARKLIAKVGEERVTPKEVFRARNAHADIGKNL